jgi:hypothetical protein
VERSGEDGSEPDQGPKDCEKLPLKRHFRLSKMRVEPSLLANIKLEE